jgi:hypothetical protein
MGEMVGNQRAKPLKKKNNNNNKITGSGTVELQS